MKVGVLGAGAIGSMFGGLIKHHAPEIDVLLVARGAHGEAMRRRGGVRVQGNWGELDVALTVSQDPSDLAGADFVLLTVKSQATEPALRQAQTSLDTAIVISIQNGINLPTLSQFVPDRQLVLGMTATNIAVSAPGQVTMQRDDVTVIGPSGSDTPRDTFETAARVLRRSQLKIVTNDAIAGAQYNKLVFNCLGAASSLSASDFLGEAILYKPWRNTVALPLQQESLRVLDRAGIVLSPVPGAADARRFRRLMRLLNWPFLGTVAEQVIRRFFNRRRILFSLGGDLERGRPTEVDFINGEIVRLATQYGAAAPRNARVVEMVHELERRGGRFARDEVMAAFAEVRDAEAAQ